ncbi:MAG: TPM domain-containing protein [Nitrospirae bacterium]|nr:TPM domain-containing protein [Nitrospirota bacterium]
MCTIGFTLIMLALVIIIAPSAHALEVPKLLGRVNDYAGMLSPQTKSTLEQQLKTVEQSDSTQIVIVTIPSLQGEVLEQFSIKVAEKWKIGQKGKDNGVILLVSKNDRKMRIEVGRGLEEKITDLRAGRIIDEVIKPRFKAGDYDGGITEGIASIIAASRGEFRAVPPPQPQQKPPVPGSFSTITGIPWGFYVLVIVIYIGIFFFGKISEILGSGLGAFFTPLAAGMLSLNPLANLTKLLFAILGLGIGYGLSVMGTSKLRIAQEYLSSRLIRESGSGSGSSGDSSSGSSGGDSGGGGGDFGGGGASGSW